MKRLYHDDMYRFPEPQPSWWEATGPDERQEALPLAGDAACDVGIIGGGYTGLSAALHLCRDHHIEARVLEAGHVGWGASGRNAGFCGIGGTSLSLPQMLRRYGPEETRRFYRSQLDAIDLVREIVDTHRIDAELSGDAELEIAQSKRAFEHLREHAARRRELIGLDNTVLSAAEFRTRYFDASRMQGAVVQRPSFALHPLRYLLGLARASVEAGARLHSHSEVVEWRKEGDLHLLVTANGTLRCRRVIVAANGFMPEHLHRGFYGRPLPLISAIVVTRPLTGDELAAQRWQTANPASTSKNVLNYYRLLPGNRFLFGGRGHSTGDRPAAEHNYAALGRELGSLFPHWREVPIDYRWHGLICITRRLTPCIGRLDDDASVYFAWGYHGSGVSTATWSGRELAKGLRAGGAGKWPDTIPVMLRGLSPPFPAASLRLGYLQARLALFRLQDALG